MLALRLISLGRLLLALLLLGAAQAPPTSAAMARGIPPSDPHAHEAAPFVYSDLVSAIRDHDVRRAVLDPQRGDATVWLSGGRRRELAIPSGGDLAARLSAAGARVEVRQAGGLGGLPLVLAALALGLLALAWLRNRRLRRGGHNTDARRATGAISPATPPDVRFADVAGCEEAVDELREFVTFLSEPERFATVGARMPSGLLLHGPPGTGKTLLAKALAGEADVSFFAVSGSEFMDRYVGVGASRVRQLFAKARAATPGAVVFIDELDAIGKRRSGAAHASNDERDHTLNQLLVELDGFDSSDRVVCVAATNRMELLDPALLRPGRLSRHVMIDLPSSEGRRAILDVHARNKPLADDADLDRLAEGTAGRSGADLADLLNEAAILAARAGRDQILQADLDEGHLRVLAGPVKRSSSLSDEEREVVAHHEAGHALVAEFSPSQDKTHQLTIRPRGRAAGLALTAKRDRSLHSTQHVHEQLMVLLGGRAAERAVYGHVSSGAANDLQQANALARSAVTELGFSPRAGQLVGDLPGTPLRLAETTHRVIDEEVERMIAEAYRDAIAMIERHRDQLDRLARRLLVSEELDRLEIADALGEALPVRRPSVEGGPRAKPALRGAHRSARRPALERARMPRIPAAVTAFLSRADRGRRAPAA
jgi:cell division protease FtsH